MLNMFDFIMAAHSGSFEFYTCIIILFNKYMYLSIPKYIDLQYDKFQWDKQPRIEIYKGPYRMSFLTNASW